MRPTLSAFLICLFAAGCAAPPPSSRAPVMSERLGEAERVSDANVIAILIAGNNADIGYGNIALAKAQRPEVKQLGQSTINDHAAVNKAVTDLAGRLGIVPVDNGISLELRDKAEEIRDELRKEDGASFDRAYLNNEIEYHTRLLAIFDRVLIPSATNPELKEFVTTVRPAVAAHLLHAQTLRK